MTVPGYALIQREAIVGKNGHGVRWTGLDSDPLITFIGEDPIGDRRPLDLELHRKG